MWWYFLFVRVSFKQFVKNYANDRTATFSRQEQQNQTLLLPPGTQRETRKVTFTADWQAIIFRNFVFEESIFSNKNILLIRMNHGAQNSTHCTTATELLMVLLLSRTSKFETTSMLFIVSYDSVSPSFSWKYSFPSSFNTHLLFHVSQRPFALAGLGSFDLRGGRQLRKLIEC